MVVPNHPNCREVFLVEYHHNHCQRYRRITMLYIEGNDLLFIIKTLTNFYLILLKCWSFLDMISSLCYVKSWKIMTSQSQSLTSCSEAWCANSVTQCGRICKHCDPIWAKYVNIVTAGGQNMRTVWPQWGRICKHCDPNGTRYATLLPVGFRRITWLLRMGLFLL